MCLVNGNKCIECISSRVCSKTTIFLTKDEVELIIKYVPTFNKILKLMKTEKILEHPINSSEIDILMYLIPTTKDTEKLKSYIKTRLN